MKERVGQRIRACRKIKKLTQEDLANSIGRSVDAISNLERGKSLPSFETLIEISQALDVPVKQFFDFAAGEEGDPHRTQLLASIQSCAESLEIGDLELAEEFLRSLLGRAQRSDNVTKLQR